MFVAGMILNGVEPVCGNRVARQCCFERSQFLTIVKLLDQIWRSGIKGRLTESA